MNRGNHEHDGNFAKKYLGEVKREGKLEGKIEGARWSRAAAILAVLEARGIAVPDEVRARITGSLDLGELDRWIRRAATAASVDELFASRRSS